MVQLKMSNDMNPALLLLSGAPSLNKGGPVRISAELLMHFLRKTNFQNLNFISSNHSLRNSEIEGILNSTPGVLNNGALNSNKENVVTMLNKTQVGLYAQLLRNRHRILRNFSRLNPVPDIIHSHDVIASGLIFDRINAKKITTTHSKGCVTKDTYLQVYPFIKGKFLERYYTDLERKAVQFSDVITFPSKGAQALFENDNPGYLENKRVEIVHNGIDLDRFKNRERVFHKSFGDSPFTILNVAYLVEEKRFDRVIDTVIELKRRGREFIVLNIGKGALEERYHNIVKNEGLENYIKFLGTMSNSEVINHIYNADIHFMPSERIVFDMITLETMAAGLPAVLTSEGGNLEIVEDGENGFLCESGNIKQYADRICLLMDYLELRKKISKNAQETIRQRFTREVMCENYLKIYRSLAE